MSELTSEQATSIAKLLNKNANSIDEYLNQNYSQLSAVQRSNLGDLRDQILAQSSKLYTESTILVMDDVQNTLEIIDKVTSGIQETLKSLQDIQKTINIATSVFNFGAAILSKNPQSIGKSVVDLVKQVKAI